MRRLKARNIEVLLCGMRAAPNLGPGFVQAFDPIYPELAAANDVLLYPFFLEGVVADPKLNIGDGLHPTAEALRGSSPAFCRRSRLCWRASGQSPRRDPANAWVRLAP